MINTRVGYKYHKTKPFMIITTEVINTINTTLGSGVNEMYHSIINHRLLRQPQLQFNNPKKFLAGFVNSDAIEYNLVINTFHNMCILIPSP